MIRPLKPTPGQVLQFVQEQALLDYSYAAVGGTQSQVPQGFRTDRNRVLLGEGEAIFRAGCQALRNWQMFPDGWTEIHPEKPEFQADVVVAMLARCFGLWWLNGCRIVYTLHEREPVSRFGFAYGTLPSHVEAGEEQFSIVWDKDDRVWYEIYSFSRPSHWLARLGFPLARFYQKKFVRHSMAQMKRIVGTTASLDTQRHKDEALGAERLQQTVGPGSN